MNRAFLLAACLMLTATPACKSTPEVDPAEAAAKLQATLKEIDTRLRDGKDKQAETMLLTLLEQQPGMPEAESRMARVRFDQKMLDDAEALAKRSLERTPDDLGLNKLMGEIQVARENFAEAGTYFGKAFALDPEDLALGVEQIRALKSAKQWQPALDVAKNIAEIDPDRDGIYTLIGDCQRELGQLDDAIKSYLTAQIKHRGDERAHAGAAQAYEAKGDYREALKQYEAYVRADCCSEYSNNVAKKKIETMKIDADGNLIEPSAAN